MIADLTHLWQHLGWPLVRLLFFLGLGLLVALLIESLNWTGRIAASARPLTRFARLPQTAAAAFSLCFFSGLAANTLLAEAYHEGRITKRELILASLFNSLPANLTHLPTTFFIMAPIIKTAAFIYLGLTVGAALGRTLLVGLVSRSLLTGQAASPAEAAQAGEKRGFRAAWANTKKRFRKRMQKIALWTVPIYILFYCLNSAGFFAAVQRFMTAHISWLDWISPQAVGIVGFQALSEFTAGVAAAGALLEAGSMQSHEVVLALLAGNVLASPLRALRHQYPYLAGIFKPALAAELIVWSQSFRALSIIAAMLGYMGVRRLFLG